MSQKYIVKIVRSAFKEIQKLSHGYSEDLAGIIRGVGEGNLGDNRKLQGYKDLWRTRKNDVRIIWTQIKPNTVLILKVGQRKDVYKGVIEDRNRGDLLNLSHILQIDENKTSDIPTFEWIDDHQTSWYQFIYGGYLYSPVLTKEQQEIFYKLTEKRLNNHPGEHTVPSLLLQSSPGTGKTVCAALMASELCQDPNWNVVLVLPEALCKEVKNFTNIKKIIYKQNNNFFLGTFQEWFAKVSPTIYDQVASLEEELEALEKEAKRSHAIKNDDTFSVHDLILYRSFIYGEESEYNHPNHLDNFKRINQIKKIKVDKWKNTLKDKNKICWLDGLKNLTDELCPISQHNETTIFIFDEAQDYLLNELNWIKTMLYRWQKECNHETILCLLGDMNQRIQPVNFDWGKLKLNKRETLKYNYRNTEKILEFANIFHGFAKERNATINPNARYLPEPCDPSSAFEKGEPIKILKVSSTDEALQFVEKLNEKIRASTNFSERSLLRKLSSKVVLLHTNISESYKNYSGIEYFTIQQAKGREFDACIAFCVFQGNGQPSFQESNNWYTMFTRPRHRLLVIATSSEINRIGLERFKKYEFFDISNTETLINWITELSNSEHLFRDIDAIHNLIDEGIKAQPIQIYWDIYAALRLTQVDETRIAKIEEEIIHELKTKTPQILNQELSQTKRISSMIDRVPLRCLILRSLGRSWQAINEASQIQNLNPQEYQRLLKVIANDLKTKGLLYEAARVESKIKIPFPTHYPFSDSFKNQTGSLVSILCKSAIDKILE